MVDVSVGRISNVPVPSPPGHRGGVGGRKQGVCKAGGDDGGFIPNLPTKFARQTAAPTDFFSSNGLLEFLGPASPYVCLPSTQQEKELGLRSSLAKGVDQNKDKIARVLANPVVSSTASQG